jgi:hypothetical protein
MSKRLPPKRVEAIIARVNKRLKPQLKAYDTHDRVTMEMLRRQIGEAK